MKRIVSLILLLPTFIYAQEGIKFEEGLTWKQVLQKAKKENKYIFVDCYATWCGPCKWMDRSIYPLADVGKYFNDKFIAIKVQLDTSKSDNDFIKNWYADAFMLRHQYKVHTFPSYLFFSPDGKIVHRETGAKSANYFITLGKEALDPNMQYYSLLEKYHRNVLDTAFMKYLARKAKDVEGEEQAGKIANAYINSLPVNELFTKDNIRLMVEFTRSTKDRGFIMFRDSAKRINETDERVKEDICKNIVLNIIYKEEIKPYCFTKKGKPDWKRIRENLKKYKFLGEEALKNNKPGIIFKTEIEPVLKTNSCWDGILPLIEKQNLGRDAEFVVGSTVVYYLNGVRTYHTEKDCKNLVAAATYYADSFSTFLSANALNTWAWTLFEYSSSKDELSLALEWIKRSNDLEPNSPEFLDTYANVLYKLGSVNEALAWEQKAIDAEDSRAKKNNAISTSVFRQCLEKMKKGEKTWPEK